MQPASSKTLIQRLDEIGRRHWWIMLLLVLFLAFAVATPAILYGVSGTFVLYQAF